MYYGFNVATLRCAWSIDHPPGEQEGIVVLEADEMLDISKIMLVTEDDGSYWIGDIVLTDEELLLTEQSKHVSEMASVKDKIDTLTDVVEFTPSDAASAELKAWRKYRAELYAMDFSSISTVKWPKTPTSEG